VEKSTVHYFRGRDGAPLAYREIGSGRPLILVHGFLSNAVLSWIHHDHAATIAAKGYRVILPDLRGHGASVWPGRQPIFPRDILADDCLALINHLGLTDYDLGGYSLGARVVARLLARGATPGRVVIGGMGLDGLEHGGGGAYFRHVLTGPDTFPPDSNENAIRAFVRLSGHDPAVMVQALDCSVTTTRAELARVRVPTLVVVAADDPCLLTAEGLAGLLPSARFTVVPGDHFSCVGFKDLGWAIADFLGAPPRLNSERQAVRGGMAAS
jgi:pimeloyl-ACP methyl ester carboxylesterase